MSTSNARIPRLKDVAQKAGVSIGTASRVLNGDADSFHPETQERVTNAARELGWRRNLLVDGIQKGRTKTIGVMIPPHDSFWIGVIAGIHMELAEHDYLPITVWIGDCREFPEFDRDNLGGVDQVSRLLDRRVDGLILWPSFAAAYFEHYSGLHQRRVPVVAIDHRFDQQGVGISVETDESLGARLVAEHLVKLGHRQIACLSAREVVEWHGWSIRRRVEFEKAITQHEGVTLRSWKTNRSGEDGLQVARQLLTSSPRPTAVFGVSDHQARLLYKAAEIEGIRIPEEVSVVGFADLDFAADLSPPLTTVRQPCVEIGRRAAACVLTRLADANDEQSVASEVICMAPTLIQRASTAVSPHA